MYPLLSCWLILLSLSFWLSYSQTYSITLVFSWRECQLLFYCCDKTPCPRQLTQERVYLGSSFQRARVRDGGMEGTGSRNWMLRVRLRDHISNHKREAKLIGNGASVWNLKCHPSDITPAGLRPDFLNPLRQHHQLGTKFSHIWT